MKLLCVDDEELILKLTMRLCRELDIVESVEGFSSSKEALKYLESNSVDVILMDIDMPEINGLAMAKIVGEKYPDTSIIFLTGYAQYAVDAFSMHASGYLLKPVSKDKLLTELEYAQNNKHTESFEEEDNCRIKARTFGNFTLEVDGKQVNFSRQKAKEIFAYLVDRQGTSVTRAEVFGELWEDGLYDRPMQKQLDVIIRSLKTTLEEYGIGDILESEKGTLRVNPDMIDCDMYRFLKGDKKARDAFRGEYMTSYEWAAVTEGYLTTLLEKENKKKRY